LRARIALVCTGVLLILLIAPFAAYAQSSNSYLDEFSEPGDQPVILSTWTYLTHNGTLLSVDLFGYGSVVIPFSVTGNQPLAGPQSLDLLQDYRLRQLVVDGQLSEASYAVPFQQSVVCSVVVPQFGGQATNEALTQAASAIKDLLPDEAASVAGVLVNIGDKLGVVGDANPYILALGAACTGGDIIENYAATQLNSCQQYVTNLRDYRAYQGMANDLATCHRAAIQKLQLAEVSPNVLIQYAQNAVTNAGAQVVSGAQGAFCYVVHCSPPPPPVVYQSVLDKVIGEIQALQSSDSGVQGARLSAAADENLTAGRLQLKASETIQAIARPAPLLAEVNAILAAHPAGSWSDSFYSPVYNFTTARLQLNNAAAQLSRATTLEQQYRFNSAIAAATTAYISASAALALARHEESIQRGLANWVYTTILLVAVLTIVTAAYLIFRKEELG